MMNPYIANSTETNSPASGLPDWHELLSIVIERIWFGVAVALIVLLVVFVQMFRAVPYYRSTAVLLVEAEQPRILQYQEIVSANVRSLEYFNTVINLLHSHQMMETALQQSGLADHPGFFPEITSVSGKASAALRLLSITPVDRSRLIHITVEHTDPQLASALANAMAQSYIQQELHNRMNSSMQAVEWLRERSVEYREKLEQGMLSLQQYREDAQSVSLEEDQNIVIAKLKSLNAALSAAQSERIAVQSQWEAIDRQINAAVARQQITMQLQDPVLSEAQAELHRHQQKLVGLLERYREDFPDVREALQKEKNLLEVFDHAFNTAVYALKSRYEMLMTREENLRKALQDQEQEAFLLSRQLVQYNDLKRNVEADKEIYESVIARMKEANISGSLPTEVIRLAEEARPAGRPFRPNRPRMFLRGGALAGLAGFGTIFLLYYADHRFRRIEEVERCLGVPVLVSLPVISGSNDRERGLASLLKPTGEIAESFRTLRAVLEMDPKAAQAKVLLVTSSQPSEGKSLVAANLAMSYARDNRRTLLLGADLRRPAVGRIFTELKSSAGLIDVLSGRSGWQDAVQFLKIPSLDVIGSKAGGDHSADLLGGVAFSEMIEQMRGKYDRIVIDAPPVLGVSDTLLLLKQADTVLFVVRYGITHSMGASQAMRRLSSSDVPCVGAVMNGVDFRSLANYYYYGRYGAYTYGQYKELKPMA